MNKIKLTGFLAGPVLFVFFYWWLSYATALTPEACKVLAVAGWMVSWWVTEATHVAITGLIPIILFPMLGVASVKETTTLYADPVIYLFMGGFIMALALEKHNLHIRIALSLIKFTGTSGNGIIAGFTLSTAFISMWISNTATAIMMLPIALSVTHLINNELGNPIMPDGHYKNFATGLMLSIAYAASIGGMATIIGTPPNVVMAGLFRKEFNIEITFLQWIKIGLPISLTILVACYFLITGFIFPNGLKKIPGSDELIRGRLTRLGKMSVAETLVLSIFFLTSLCWIFRPVFNQWLGDVFYHDGLKHDILDDTTIAMTGGFLVLVVPIRLNKNEFLLSWEDMKKLPWGVLILFGGGMCLAAMLDRAGLIAAIGQSISKLGDIGIWSSLIVLCLISLVLTELMSNVALVTVFVPVVFGIAKGLGHDPLLLAMPVTFVASCGFSMPVSTPPNTILFGTGYIRQSDMLKAGMLLNVVSVIIIVVLSMILM